MIAYILHCKKEWLSRNDEVAEAEEFSAWATERQAFVAAGKYLLEQCDWAKHNAFGQFAALSDTIKFLVESEKYKEAVNLVNEQSRMEIPKNTFHVASSKIRIKITKSAFKGSPFE